MDYQTLQDAVKSDLKTIQTLKLGIVSARELYGTFFWFVLKLSLIVWGINILMLGVCHAIGYFHPKLSFDAYLHMCVSMMGYMWFVTLGMSMFLISFLSPIVLFSKLVKDHLKTAAFIKRKCIHFSLIYLLFYAVIYGVITALSDGFNGEFYQYSRDGYELTDLIKAQIMSVVASMMFMSFFINMEVNRQGFGIVFEVIQTYAARIKNGHQVKPEDGSSA